jgi:hypothetical protein
MAAAAQVDGPGAPGTQATRLPLREPGVVQNYAPIMFTIERAGESLQWARFPMGQISVNTAGGFPGHGHAGAAPLA